MTDSEAIPTKDDWIWPPDCDYYVGDCNYACDRFLGKSLEQTMEYFLDAPLGAVECISYMPEIPFRYYMKAFEMLFTQEKYRRQIQQPDGARSFLLLIKHKLQDEPNMILPIMAEVLPVAEFVATHQVEFDADLDIYGSFLDLLDEIRFIHRSLTRTERLTALEQAKEKLELSNIRVKERMSAYKAHAEWQQRNKLQSDAASKELTKTARKFSSILKAKLLETQIDNDKLYFEWQLEQWAIEAPDISAIREQLKQLDEKIDACSDAAESCKSDGVVWNLQIERVQQLKKVRRKTTDLIDTK